MSVALSKELRALHNTRSVPLRVGDSCMIVRGAKKNADRSAKV